MEHCHLCLGPLEGTNSLCQDCSRSNQEACKHAIRERKAVLHLLNQERKVLTRKVKEIVENNEEQRQISNANLEAAKAHSIRNTTLRYAQETVKKEEQQVEELRSNIAKRRAALNQAKEMLALMKKKLEEDKQKANQPATTTTTTTTTITTETSPISPSSSSQHRHRSSSKSLPSSPASSQIQSSQSHPSSRSSSHSSPSSPQSSSHSSHPSLHSSHSSSHHSSSHSSRSSSHSHSSSHPTSHSSHHHSSHSSHSSRTHSSSSHSSHSHSSSHHSSSHSHSSRSQPPSPSRSLSSSQLSTSLSQSLLSLSPPEAEAKIQITRQKLAQARRAIVSELLSFIPINPSPSASETETIIMNVTMPNNGMYHTYRPDALSAALGYVAHVVYLLASYLGVSLPWRIDFAGARSSVWHPFEGKRYPLFGNRYSEIEPGLNLLNNDIVYLCGSQGVHIPLSSHQSTLPNLLALLRSPTLGLPGPIEVATTERIKVSRPPLRVKEPPSPITRKPILQIEQEKPKEIEVKEKGKEDKKKQEEEDEDDDFIVLDHPTIPTPEQTDELEQFERAMFIDTT